MVGTWTPRLLNGAANVMLAANEAGSGDMLSVDLVLALVDQFVAPLTYPRNGSYHAKRPTSDHWIVTLYFKD
jgi:hypothetical protein